VTGVDYYRGPLKRGIKEVQFKNELKKYAKLCFESEAGETNPEDRSLGANFMASSWSVTHPVQEPMRGLTCAVT
jgi:hypothetical protein